MINGSRLAGNQWPASGRDPIPLSDAFAVIISVSPVNSVATPTVHKSAQSGQSVDRPVPPVPMSGIRKLRFGLRRRGGDQPAGTSGNVVQTYHYNSSGSAMGFSPSAAITNYLYDQQFFDTISGQYYMRARNYDPTTGTFTQSDTYAISPGDPANANLYLFAGADPVNMFDPSGRFGIMDTLGSFAINGLLTAGFDVAGNALGGNKSVEEILAESTVGGLLGVIGGPMIAGKFADSVVPELVKFLPDVGRMEKYVQFAVRGAALGLFRAVYNTTALYIVYFFEHPDHPLTFDQTKWLFFASLITTGSLGALEKSELGPDIQAALAEIGANPTGALGALETIGLAVPRMLANVNISGVAGDAILAFADEFVKFFSEQAAIGH